MSRTRISMGHGQKLDCRRSLALVIVAALLQAIALQSVARADSAEAWGLGFSGQLGNGTTEYSYSIPNPVIGLDSGVTAVAAGTDHSIAIQNGAVLAWGDNNSGELGNGSNSGRSSIPISVNGLGTGVTAIAGGDHFTVAIQNGAAVAWGNNFNGQLGNGTTTSSPVPVGVQGLGSGVTAIAAGAYGHCLAIQNGSAWAWGDNVNGELGDASNDDSDVPVAVTGLSSGVSAVAAGKSYSLAIQNGGVKAWGDNYYKTLGNGSNADSNVPVAVSGLASGVTAIAAGTYQGLAIRDGDVYAWGTSAHGELGNGSMNDSPIPVKVLDLDVDLTAVAAGRLSSYALSSDGSLWVWGGNMSGQLGLGTYGTTDVVTPQQLLPPPGFVFTSIDADAFGDHVLATLAAVPEPAAPAFTILVVAMTIGRRRIAI